jgi:hypothetical protein
MCAIMAWQGGRVHLEQSNLPLALSTAKMAKEGFICAAIKETNYLIKKPHTDIREKKDCGVQFPRNRKVKAVIEGHPAMLCHNHMNGYLAFPNGTTKNPYTFWRSEGTGAQCSQIVNFPAGYVYSRTAYAGAESFNLDPSAEDSQLDTDYVPNLLTDEGSSAGLYALCCVVMQLTSSLTTGAA